jgi:UPF0042 nucleotide-binding protein
VFGPPGGGTELAAVELRSAGFEAEPWDGTVPHAVAQDPEALDAGHWPLLLRLECAAPVCASRAGEPWSSPVRPQAAKVLLGQWEARRERQLAARLRSTLVLDTTRLTPATLRERLGGLPLQEISQPRRDPVVVLESFRFAAGVPLDLDWCLDTRTLRNPYWEPELRDRSGLDPTVQDFVLEQEPAQRLLEGIERLVDSQLPAFLESRLRRRLVVRLAIGCTGGFHRSVAVAEELNRRLQRRGLRTLVWHRDLAISQ